MSLRSTRLVIASLGVALAAHADFVLLNPDGDFEEPGQGSWIATPSETDGAGPGGGSVFAFPDTGGNPGGFGQLNIDTGNFAVLVSQDVTLDSLGLTAGEAYNFQMDMINLDGPGDVGLLKVEFLPGLGDTGNMAAPAMGDGSTWQTYTFPARQIPEGTTGLRFVPVTLEIPSNIGFDNVGVDDTPVVLDPITEIPDSGFDQGQSTWAKGEGGGTINTYPSTGGFPGSYGRMDDTSGAEGSFGVFVANGGDIIPLEGLGLEAGKTYAFMQDMILEEGDSMGTLKLEFFNGAGPPASFEEKERPSPIGDGGTWATYVFEFQIPLGVDGIKVVPVWGPGSIVGFDNVMVDPTPITTPPLPAGGIPNGDFEIADGANWGTTQGTPAFPAMGGNPDGFAQLDGTGEFTVLYAFDNTETTFASLGLNPGDNYTIQLDMQLISGSNIGGIRLEGPDGYVVESFPPLQNGGDWDTYRIELTVPASPAQTKIGLRPGDGSVVAFDNVGLIIPETVPFVAEIKTGTVVSWTPSTPENNYQPQESEDGVTYTDLGPLVSGDSGNMAFDAVESPFYQVLEYEVMPIELLGDPGFELGDFSWSYTTVDETVFELSDEDEGEALARTGNWCIRLAVDTGETTTPEQALILQGLGLDTVAPGDVLDLSFWVNTESEPVGGTVLNYQIQWRNDTGAVIDGQNVSGSFNTPIGVWTEVSVPGLVAPAMANSAFVLIEAVTGAQAGDSASVRIDDVSLTAQSSMLLPTPLDATVTDGVQVCWPTKDGSSYQPKSSTLLDTFADFGPPIAGDGTVKSVFDVLMPPAKFFVVEETP